MSDERTHDEDGRPLPATDSQSFYPDRMLPIHNDRHCPHLDRAMIQASDPDEAKDVMNDFVAGAWDGWLGFMPVPGAPLSSAYWYGRTWGVDFARAGSPW